MAEYEGLNHSIDYSTGFKLGSEGADVSPDLYDAFVGTTKVKREEPAPSRQVFGFSVDSFLEKNEPRYELLPSVLAGEERGSSLREGYVAGLGLFLASHDASLDTNQRFWLAVSGPAFAEYLGALRGEAPVGREEQVATRELSALYASKAALDTGRALGQRVLELRAADTLRGLGNLDRMMGEIGGEQPLLPKDNSQGAPRHPKKSLVPAISLYLLTAFPEVRKLPEDPPIKFPPKEPQNFNLHKILSVDSRIRNENSSPKFIPNEPKPLRHKVIPLQPKEPRYAIPLFDLSRTKGGAFCVSEGSKEVPPEDTCSSNIPRDEDMDAILERLGIDPKNKKPK